MSIARAHQAAALSGCRLAVFAIHLAPRLLSAHVERAPCVPYVLSALSLLYETRRGAWRHSCQDSAEVRNFLVEPGRRLLQWLTNRAALGIKLMIVVACLYHNG